MGVSMERFISKCPDNVEMVTGRDFRAAQCEDHNGTPLDGVSYQWKPYYGRKYGEIYIFLSW